MKLINDVITHLLDPNIYYSRFSFLESGIEAINIKYEVIDNLWPNLYTLESQNINTSKNKKQILY